MSPGMTMTPGIGGTSRSWPASDGIFSVNPTTDRFGIWAWSFNVSGMSVLRLGRPGTEICGKPT